MIATDEDALICDFAETYHVYDYRALSPKYAATLASGLGDDTRIIKKLSGEDVGLKTALMALILDNTNLLVWSKTKDAEKGRNRPASIWQMINGGKKTKRKEYGYASAEDFEAAKRRIIGKG